METLITLLIIAVIWILIKSSRHQNDFDLLNQEVDELLGKLETMQRSIKYLQKSRDKQHHKNHELRQAINELEKDLQNALNNTQPTNPAKQIQTQTKEQQTQNYDINHLDDIQPLANPQTPIPSQTLPLPVEQEFTLDTSSLENLVDSTNTNDSTKQPHQLNPDFPIFYYSGKFNLTQHLPLAYSFTFSQFLQTKLQQQQWQIQNQANKHAQSQVKKQAPATNKSHKPTRATKPHKPRKPNEPSIFDKAINFAKNWLTTGNIPVKIGMLVLISAVIAFLRYATTMGWISVPIEAKLMGVAISALGALVFAWTKRESKRSFSLIVQGGSIGIVLLTIFSAVKMYSLISPTLGFVISFAMVLLMAVLSIQQNAKPLAVMAIFAGFLAPIWLSDGSGSHVVLFSYYAMLNVGIFVLAMLRPWRELNLLGFVFTYLIGSTWGGLHYTPEQFSTTEPFVVLFFIFYLLIPLRYAQQADHLLEADSSPSPTLTQNENEFYNKYKLNSGLIFGTPLITLGLQVALLESDTHLALSCVAMGLVYGILALLLKSNTDENRMLTTLKRTYTGLSAIFLTLAVPIGLSAKATTTIFALEGAGAVWLGANANPKRRRTLTWLAGGFLQLSSAVAFMVAYADEIDKALGYGRQSAYLPILNEIYLSGILMAVAGFACAWFSYHAVKNWQKNSTFAKSRGKGIGKDTEHPEYIDGNSFIEPWLTNGTLLTSARLFFLWGLAWWLTINSLEVLRIFDGDKSVYANLILLAVTASALPAVYHHRKGYGDGVVWASSTLLLMVGGVVACLQFLGVVIGGDKVTLNWAIGSWLVFAIGGFMVWRALQSLRSALIEWSIVIWLLSLTLTISTLVYQLLPHGWQRDTGWHWAIIFAIWIIVGVLDIFRPQVLAWLAIRPTLTNLPYPLFTQSDKIENDDLENTAIYPRALWNNVVSWVVAAVLALVFAITIILSGSDGWWLPIVNSVDGLQISLAILILAWCVRRRFALTLLVAYAVSLATIGSMTVRMLSHWTDWTSWQADMYLLNDWQWLMVFGFWIVLAVGLWALLSDKLSAISERLESLSDDLLPVLQIVLNAIMLTLFGSWGLMLLQSGTVSPWLPLLNPLAILQSAILGLAWLWATGSVYQDEILDRSKRSLVLACMLLALISVMTLRFTFHMDNDIVWGMSMFSTAKVQMALTLVWSILGVVGWIVGSKRLSKPIWLLGAVLMTVVLVKLILIDREHLGDLFGIGSFFAYGLLCVIIGYVAPIPQIGEAETEEMDNTMDSNEQL